MYYRIKLFGEVFMFKLKFQNYFGHMNLHKRLISYFIIVCIIPLLIIGSTSVIVSMQSTRDSAIQFSNSTLLQVKTRIESLMDTANTVSLQLAEDFTIQTTLRKPLNPDIAQQYETDLTMDTYLNYELAYMKDLYGFYIIGENKSAYKSAYNSFRSYDLTSTLWYKQIINSDEPIWFPTYKDSRAVQTSGQYFISRGMPIKDKTSDQNLGIILIDIKVETLEQILIDAFGDLGQVMIIDDQNTIVASSNNMFEAEDPTVIESIELTSLNTNTVNDAKRNGAIVLNQPLENSDWRIIAIVPEKEILKDNMITITLFISLIILISALSYYISKIITSTITSPINDIILLMKKVESGDMNVSTEVLYDDEIGKLSSSFNIMTLKVKSLMATILEEQYKLRKYELKALQSQINPHFMYNTLDSVVWLARMNRTDDIVDIVSAMTRLFRIGLSRGKDIITIREEIEHVTNYLKIQKFRYRDQLEYELEVPEELSNYRTLKLVLQPLVENSIYHGLKVKKHGGKITIKAIELEDSIQFKIIDTGAGMDKDTLNAIHNAFDTKNDKGISMYGIKNVNERIEIFFGNNYGLRYESNYGHGTTAIVTIPKFLGDESNAKNNHY